MSATESTASQETRPRLILVDDHRLVVDALSRFLSQEYEIVAVASSGDELLALLPQRPADCLLLDLEMPGKNGLVLLPSIRRLQPAMKILVVSMFLDRVLTEAALSAGAHGFVPKDAGGDELQVAIAEVLAGRRYVSPRVPKTSHRVSLGAQHLGLHRLTPRQQEIVLLIGEGKSGTEICLALALSPSTITFHKHNIMRVLGIDSEAGLVRYSVLVRAGSTPQEVRNTTGTH